MLVFQFAQSGLYTGGHRHSQRLPGVLLLQPSSCDGKPAGLASFITGICHQLVLGSARDRTQGFTYARQLLSQHRYTPGYHLFSICMLGKVKMVKGRAHMCAGHRTTCRSQLLPSNNALGIQSQNETQRLASRHLTSSEADDVKDKCRVHTLRLRLCVNYSRLRLRQHKFSFHS